MEIVNGLNFLNLEKKNLKLSLRIPPSQYLVNKAEDMDFYLHFDQIVVSSVIFKGL